MEHNGSYKTSGSIVKRRKKKEKAESDDDEKSPSRKLKESRTGSVTPADAGMDDQFKFEFILANAIEDARAQNPGKTIVVVVDGGGPHTVEPSTSLRPSNLTTEEMRTKLVAAGLVSLGTKTTASETKRMYTDSWITRTQWTNAELIALEQDAVVLYLPLCHPFLNVIEQVKERFVCLFVLFVFFFLNKRCGEL